MKLSYVLNAMLVCAAMTSASASAGPILSDADALGANVSFNRAAGTALFSHMGLNGGQTHSVAFIGEDNSIMIGHYAKGPWAKNEFLRAWQDIRDKNGSGLPDFAPVQQPVSRLPEPSTFALLGLGLVAFGVLRRRQTRR